METPLHSLNPVTRFSSRASDYARFRPTYPGDAAAAILADLGPPSSLIAADIGAGTGISARWLAGRGVRTIAVEPNEPMRLAAEPHPLVEWRDGRAEATGLAGNSVDLILCAQAFHWFEPDPTLAEFSRILRRGGRLALMWNTGDKSDPLTAAYYEAVNSAAEDPTGVSSRGAPDPFWRSTLFVNQRELTYRHTQLLDEEGLIGRALSASYIPQAGPAAARLIQQLRQGYRQHAPSSRGLVYITNLFLAERP